MASWLIRIDSSFGTLIGSWFEICSGLHVFVHRWSWRWGVFWLSLVVRVVRDSIAARPW